MNISEAIDYVNRKKIQPPSLSEGEMEEELKGFKVLFEEMDQ